MTPELYLPEFRDFKYLQSSAPFVEWVKENKARSDRVIPVGHDDTKPFSWHSRIEFIEQIMDHRDSEIFIVEPGEVARRSETISGDFHYESGRVSRLPRPIIYEGHPVNPFTGREITLEDIRTIEDDLSAEHKFYLCSRDWFDNDGNPPRENMRIFNLNRISLIPTMFFRYTAVFFNRAEAEMYCDAITAYMNDNYNSISAFIKAP